VLRLWHFGPSTKDEHGALKPPTAEQLTDALKLVGGKHVRVRRDPPALWKDAPGVELELSSIAPGYAVDLLIERIASMDFGNVMVELGGEVRAVGTRPDGTPWRIGVERADPEAPAMLQVLPLKNMASSTAGDYKNVRTEDGRQVTHIIDPRTGQALAYRGAAVTVVAKTCLETDALDTPLLVMGPKVGYDWCVKHKVAALFQTPKAETSAEGAAAGEVQVVTTPHFDELVPKSHEAKR
jgi:thiamine biosynthesis lipoprotein